MAILNLVLLAVIIAGLIVAITLGSVAVQRSSTSTLPSNVVLLNSTQTLTNKTLTAPSVYHLKGSSPLPTVTPGGVISATSLSAESTDTSGTINGTIAATNLQVAVITVTFSAPFATKPAAVIVTNLIPELKTTANFHVLSWDATSFIIAVQFTGTVNIASNLFSYMVV